MPLSADVVAARIAWRVALLRLLAAETFARHGSSLARPYAVDPRRPWPARALPPPRSAPPGGDGRAS